MKINRHNYEHYFIDYLEGQLSEAMQQEVTAFLQANPDLQEELSELEAAVLPAHEVTMANKNALKKPAILPENEGNWWDEQCIAYWEGDLSPRQASEVLAQSATHTQRNQAFQTFGRARLSQNEQVPYPAKGTLKRHTLPLFAGISEYRSVAAAAAVLLLAAMAWLWWPQTAETPAIVDIRQVQPQTLQWPQADASPPAATRQALAQGTEKPRPGKGTHTQTTASQPQAREIVVYTLTEADFTGFDQPVASQMALVMPPTMAKTPSYAQENPYIDRVEQQIANTLARIRKEEQTSTLAEVLQARINMQKLDSARTNIRQKGLWALAEYSVDGISRLTGRPMNLAAQPGENGQVKRVAFQSQLIELEVANH